MNNGARFMVVIPWILSAVLAVFVVILVLNPKQMPARIFNSACNKQFPLTSYLLDCSGFDENAASVQALDSTLDQAAANDMRQGKAKRISIWVQDLQTKQYASTDELDTYDPASLLKLPLAIAYYKFAEIQPSVLTDSVTYATPSELNEKYNYFTATTSLVVGQQYSVQELIERMLENSDNGAYFTLLHHVQTDFYNKVNLDLGIQIPSNSNVLNFMTAKTYGNIFRTLYNASYLNHQDSETVLEDLASSTFDGIRAQLPSSVGVADKFGERSVYDQNGNSVTKELHDCGIVYKNPDPYVICIMTEGGNFDQLKSIISDISEVAYNQL